MLEISQLFNINKNVLQIILVAYEKKLLYFTRIH